MSAAIPLSSSARSDLGARIDAEDAACKAAKHRNDLVAADSHWRSFIGLLEVQMGRTDHPSKLTPEQKA